MAAKLTNMKIGEVSFCRKGMNRHAKVAIFKSADLTPVGIAKATFAEALEGSLIASSVNEAFYTAFDGLWQRNEAFRTALTDELTDGGDGSVASEAYKASVHELVDAAVAEARAAGVTAADTNDIEKALTAAADRWLMAKKETTMKISNKAELQAAVSKFSVATSTVGDMRTIQKAATDLNLVDILPAELAPAESDPALAKAQTEIAILKLAPEARTYFNGLAEADQTAFLAKSADDQKADVEKANATDPVLHKCKDGTEIRKSDGVAALMMAKRLDKQDGEIAELRGNLTGSTIEKRASEDFPNVAKAVAVDMLKSVETVGADSEAGKAVLKSLKTMNDGGGRMFKSLGSTDDDAPTGDLAKARTDFDTEVSKIASRDKIDRAAAMTKARAEHPDLFKAAHASTFEAAEESAEIARSHGE